MKVRRIFLPGSNEVQNADEPETDSNCGVTNDARHTLTVLLIVPTAPSNPLFTLQKHCNLKTATDLIQMVSVMFCL
jgi:hypothetical protein